MKIFSKILGGLITIMIMIVVVGFQNHTYAKCQEYLRFSDTIGDNQTYYTNGGSDNVYSFSVFDTSPNKNVLINGTEYTLNVFIDAKFPPGKLLNNYAINSQANGGVVSFVISEAQYPNAFKVSKNVLHYGLQQFKVEFEYNNSNCLGASYIVHPAKVASLTIEQERNGQSCFEGNGGCIEVGTPIIIKATFVNGKNEPINDLPIDFILDEPYKSTKTDASGFATANFNVISSGVNKLSIQTDRVYILENFTINIQSQCDANNPLQCNTEPTNYSTRLADESMPIAKAYKICSQIDEDKFKELYERCKLCVGSSEKGRDGIWTAIGCIKNDPIQIVQNLIRIGLGMGGGVALLMILASGFIFSTSQGDPKKVGDAKEMIIAAVTGLLFVIFSVTILEFIGYSVFRIPGFGG